MQRSLCGAIAAVLGLADAAARAEVPHLAEAMNAEVVVIGEYHDNPIHHQTQAGYAAALLPRAIVFEMIPESAEPRLAELRSAGAPRAEIAAALDWANSGWPDFDWYAPIMEAAPSAAILGAEAPREALRRAVREGAGAVLGARAARFGIDRPLPPEAQAKQEQLQADAHCGMLPDEMLPGMVEAQRLRDALLADAILRGLALPGEGPVLVITGNGHSGYDSGAPALLRVADPDLEIFALAQLEAPPEGEIPYDAAHVTAPAERDDPCAALEAR